jgi:shikimate dehydrogenase
VYDIVYSPLQTGLLQQAKQLGYSTVDGLGMLLWQAAYAFELWHDILPDVSQAVVQHIMKLKGE